jgi:cbb3-type cytochrome oxidase subunit 3
MRPSSIVNFERVVLLSLLLGVINSYLIWDQTTARVAAQGMGPQFVIGVQVATIAIYLLLIWFISRKGSPVAKWIYVVLCAIGLVAGVVAFRQTLALGTVPALITAVQYLLSLASLWFLFRPESKAWFEEGRGGPDPDTFA